MITRAEVEKLGALHVTEPTMLSLYLAVPPSADLAVLCIRADELIAAAEAVAGQAVEPRAGERVRGRPAPAVAGLRDPGHATRRAVRQRTAARSW